MEKDLLDNPEMIMDIIGWDVMNWTAALDYWGKILTKNTGGKALEIGAGPGGISLFIAKCGLDVLCSDLDNPKERVSALHDKYEHKNTISYEAINALEIPYENHFDVVVFKSVIGGVARGGQDERRNLVMEQICKCLKPGGYLLFAENLISSPLHQFFRKHFVQWGSEWNYGTEQNMKDAMSKFVELNYRTTGFLGAFGRTEFQRRLLSSADKVLLNKIVPKSWHYIMYGSARKN